MQNFIGHTRAQNRLEKFLKNADTAKSFLFCGPKGLGKRTLAQAFARAYVRRETVLDFSDTYCEDVFFVAPVVEEKKGVIKEKKIDIDSLRDSMRNISLSSAHHGRRVLLVDEAQQMTGQAQNALLKTLEEPARGVMILLVAHTLDTLLPTILSRCEKVSFGMVSSEAFQKNFSETGEVDPEHLRRLSLGLPGLAREMLQNKQMFSERTEAERTISRLDALSMGDRLRLGEQLSKNIPKAIEMLHLWAFFFREEALLGRGNVQILFGRVEKMHECARLLKNTQVNGRLILENTLLSL